MSQLKKLLFVTFLFFVILFITKVHSFDPSTVNGPTKTTWCSDQMATCTNICLDGDGHQPSVNYCTPDTLAYDCVCSNGVSPNSTEYTQTIPYFACTADQQTCINNCKPTTDACVNACNSKSCAATVIKAPSQIPTTVQGSNSPAAPGTTGTTGTPGTTVTPTKNPNTLLSNAAAMTYPIQGCFMLLFTLVVAFLARINLAWVMMIKYEYDSYIKKTMDYFWISKIIFYFIIFI